MEIRTATKEDLPGLLELGEEFGHLMLYQKDLDVMKSCLPRILVAEEPDGSGGLIVSGYYHYIVSDDPGFEEMLRCYRQFPEELIQEAVPLKDLCITMQGASHRDTFGEFIMYLRERFSEIWCYCSSKSQRPNTYKDLGFTFNPDEEFRFWNVNKGDYSNYRLGRWERDTD